MAFTDALIDHADVHVTIVDRRHAPGGHWVDAYPFVRLHQASLFYGVASTVLGTNAIQQHGPEAGLHERAGLAEIRAYYDNVMEHRFLAPGRVTFLSGSDYRADGASHLVTSRVSGEQVQLNVRHRVVDAAYIAPTIPATTPAPFGVAEGVRVIAVGELAAMAEAAGTYVIVGSGKTATDAIIWLLGNGVGQERIVWVRPRDPWMVNRATVQPDPAVFIGLGADTFAAAAESATLDEMFLRLEAAGAMLRVDPNVVPTMARAPTLAVWERDLLRTIENVVRMGRIRRVEPGELVLDEGSVSIPRDALIVHCAAAGLQHPPVVPIWGDDLIRLQTIRAGFPCFAAALAGYVEATRDDDRERNRVCPPNVYPNSLADWARMQYRGALNAASFGAEPDIAAWVNQCLINPARIDPALRESAPVKAALARVAANRANGLKRMAELISEPPPA